MICMETVSYYTVAKKWMGDDDKTKPRGELYHPKHECRFQIHPTDGLRSSFFLNMVLIFTNNAGF